MNYAELFDSMYPGFFQEDSIRRLPEGQTFTELMMDLRGHEPVPCPFPCPEGITFGEYHGDLPALRAAVSRVDEDWVQYFNEGGRFYCAFDGDAVAAFCCLTDFGRFRGLRIGGPGCVGTVPEYRKLGIGLEMVRRATEILRQDGFDLSWIHFTHLERWYMKLGYQPVLRWNSRGLTG